MGIIYQLDNYVTLFEEQSKRRISQPTKRLGQSYLLFIVNPSEHNLEDLF